MLDDSQRVTLHNLLWGNLMGGQRKEDPQRPPQRHLFKGVAEAVTVLDDSEVCHKLHLSMLSGQEVSGAKRQNRPQVLGIPLPTGPL